MGSAAAPGRRRSARTAVVAAALAALAGCASSAQDPAVAASAAVDPAPVVLTTPVLTPDQPVPTPQDPPVLRITGRIGTTNGAGDALSLDPATLDQLGRLRVTVYEPWVKQTLDFQGVWLADLLRLARADPAASSVHITALDDYQVDLPLSEIMAGGVLLATRDGAGQPIRIEDGGPTRIVFTGGVPSGVSPDQWIWSLSTIDVR